MLCVNCASDRHEDANLVRVPKKMWLDIFRDDNGSHVLYIPERIPIRVSPEKN